MYQWSNVWVRISITIQLKNVSLLSCCMSFSENIQERCKKTTLFFSKGFVDMDFVILYRASGISQVAYPKFPPNNSNFTKISGIFPISTGFVIQNLLEIPEFPGFFPLREIPDALILYVISKENLWKNGSRLWPTFKHWWSFSSSQHQCSWKIVKGAKWGLGTTLHLKKDL